MQFQVPQFIDEKPKIVGPLTIQQFLILAGGFIPVFLLFFVLAFWLWAIVAAVLVTTSVGLTFGKYNGQSLPKVLIAAANFFWKPRVYLWKKETEFPKIPDLPKIDLAEKPKRKPMKDILLKITTTKHPIAKREKTTTFLKSFKIPQDDYETVRQTTGDRKVAKRIDYQ
jgi:hypothetical protein